MLLCARSAGLHDHPASRSAAIETGLAMVHSAKFLWHVRLPPRFINSGTQATSPARGEQLGGGRNGLGELATTAVGLLMLVFYAR